jgi:hypothetical protein
MILSAYGSAAAFSADRINAPKERPTLRQMFGISAEIEDMLKERHVKREYVDDDEGLAAGPLRRPPAP